MSQTTKTFPMSSLIPSASERPGEDPIFALNSEAERRAAEGESIINATLGVLTEDDGALAIMPSVFDALTAVPARSAAAYAPIAGDQAFNAAIIRDVFGASTLAENAIGVATAGGTGALHHAVINYVQPGEALLTTSYYWSPYRIIADHAGRGVETFEMFSSDGTFNLEAMRSGLFQLMERQGRALIIFNFPCHNPTGYSLDAEEWEGVGAILAEASEKGPVIFMLDLAYAHYGQAARWIAPMEAIADRITLLVAWSASKSFLQYGARVGGLLGVTLDPEERQRMSNALAYSCRGVWSNCNHAGLLAVTELLTDPELKVRVARERERAKALLGERVALFNEKADKLGLKTPRYEGGFFVAVFAEDAPATAARAREKGVFVVPMDGALRVAICATPTSDIPRLVQVLAVAAEG
jgi:aromatic-amino-acid transaminase